MAFTQLENMEMCMVGDDGGFQTDHPKCQHLSGRQGHTYRGVLIPISGGADSLFGLMRCFTWKRQANEIVGIGVTSKGMEVQLSRPRSQIGHSVTHETEFIEPITGETFKLSVPARLENGLRNYRH